MASVTFPVGLGGSGITIDDSSNPGVGLGNGGHKTLFVPALSQTVVMAQTAVTSANNASGYMTTTNGYMTTTLGYQNAASASATLAQNWATQLVTPVSGGEYSAKYWAQASAASAAASAMVTFTDNFAVVKGTADNTKLLKFDVSTLISTATTRTITIPNRSGTMALADETGLALIATIIPTASAANVDFLNVFTATFDSYLVRIEGVGPNSGTSSQLNIVLANGGSVDTGTNYSSTTTPGSPTWSTSSGGSLASASSISDRYFASLEFSNVNAAANKVVFAKVIVTGPANGSYVFPAIRYTSASTVSGFRLNFGGGNTFAASGIIRVYGYKNS